MAMVFFLFPFVAKSQHLFVGIHEVDGGKGLYCRDKEYETTEFKYEAEFGKISNGFTNKYKNFSPLTRLIKPNVVCLIYKYEFKKNRDCTVTGYSILTGKSLENVRQQLANQKTTTPAYRISEEMIWPRPKER